MTQAYSDAGREHDPHALPDLEVFYWDEPTPGWYWWPCSPGCLPDSEAVGPFESEALALADARKGIPQTVRRFRLVIEYDLDDPTTTAEDELKYWLSGRWLQRRPHPRNRGDQPMAVVNITDALARMRVLVTHIHNDDPLELEYINEFVALFEALDEALCSGAPLPGPWWTNAYVPDED